MGEMEYQEFIKKKSQIESNSGFNPLWMPDFLFDFQKSLVAWAVLKGRAALFEDCGLGKTAQQLVWGQNVVMHTNKPVLCVTPLAVSGQTRREGDKFGIECRQSRDGKVYKGITVTNYEKLHLFNPDDYGGVILDESSAIKAFNGVRRRIVTRFMSDVKYRLLCTATAAPNDYIELGTSSEALGVMTQSEMLEKFFKSSDNMRHSLFKEGDFWNRAKYFFLPHSEPAFWRWVCSWARAIRLPSDIGCKNEGFELPELTINQHVVDWEYMLEGELFPKIAVTMAEQRAERKSSMRERCEKVCELVNHDNPSVIWCQYNPEGELLEKMIPGSVEVAGRHCDDEKEERFEAFTTGIVKKLICKPKIGAWGLNWQHCAHQTYFPSHSFEQFYQGVRRSWRYGQQNEVVIDVVTTEGEKGVTENLMGKQKKTEKMFVKLVNYMNDENMIKTVNLHTNQAEVPKWV